MATISRNGYGQVEANHLSMQQTGQIYAQGYFADNATQLENGQFVKYAAAKTDTEDKLGLGHKIVFGANEDAIGEYLMVFNEIKLYGAALGEGDKDYAMKAADFTDKLMVPRLIKTNVGDIYTTNCVGAAGAYRTDYAGIAINVGDVLSPDAATGFLKVGAGEIEFTVIKVYTMPDGQPAVKLQRTK